MMKFVPRDLNTVFVLPLTSNLFLAEYNPNVLLSENDTGLSKDSVAVIHLAGAVNKFALVEKAGQISEEKYQKLVFAINSFVSN